MQIFFVRPLSVLSPSWATNMSRLFSPNYLPPGHFLLLVASKNWRRGSHRFSATLIRTSCENWPLLRWIVSLCRAIAWSMKATVLGRGRMVGLDQIPNFQGGSSHGPGTIWKGDEMMRKNAGADLKYRI